MKSLKIKNILLCAFAATTLLSSCSDFLDKLPENKVDEEKVDYTNLNNMYQPVSGVYAKLRQRGSHWIVWGATVVRDDDVSTGRIDDQADLVAIDQSYNYNAGFGEPMKHGWFTMISSKLQMQHWKPLIIMP